MASEKPVDKLADNLKGLVIGASGTIPGYQHVDQADKLEGCQIVNIDWLLQKIATDIPKSVQEKILKREKNADIEPKGKKRARESSLGDDQGNSSKKTKDEEQIKLKSMIALVDKRYPTSSSTLSVYQDDAGLTWDATLVRSGQNKAVEVSRIQLLVHGESQTFHTWDLQYEFGSSEESNSIGNAGTLDSAKRTFRSKFKSRSHLAWKDRHAIPNAKGWIFLETHHREAPIFTSKTTPLPASVENVLKIIFTSGNLQNYLHLLHTHGRSVLVENKVDKKKLLVGIAVLGKLMDLTDPQLAPVYIHHGGGTVHKKWRDAEYIHPDFKGFRVPDVRVGTTTAGGRSGFYHSEYVVENPAQIRQRYLFHVKVV
ncbi:hypothetical protein N7519_006954 [Penicillium mononematosum]|uniref:uncharacterized protein n=1 Tax=Penicillium mononematosum TaxID=268346 RepID=UPI002547C6D5|nr:uncharacterized protein N7519_006954 [Penicillium mononematosum]KAJ6185653.1 hypothetical protein N7519_006954 [Penicillium mononematosum]